MSSYTYPPLNPDPLEIRLLEFVSQEDESPIRLKVHTAYIQDKPKFTALSYVWGNPSQPKEAVVLDGCEFEVTETLAMALRCVSKHGPPVFPDRERQDFRVWIDAICINQKDVLERNHHVPHMRVLYEVAELVISCLGREDQAIRRALAILDTVGSEVLAISSLADWEVTSEDLGSSNLLAWMSRHPSLCTEDMDSTEDGHYWRNTGWLAVYQFLQLPYWERAWIFQEVVLAQKIIVVSGEQSVPFEKLEAFATWVWRLQGHDGFALPGVVDQSILTGLMTRSSMPSWKRLYAMYLAKRRRKTAPPEPGNIHGWINSFAGCDLKAGNPKDLVYGLMGVSNINIQVDYSTDTSLGVVYRDYASAWLDHWKTHLSGRGLGELGFLGYAGLALVQAYGQDHSFPSWAPHFPFLSQSLESVFMVQHGPNCLMKFPPEAKSGTVKDSALIVDAIDVDSVASVFQGWSLDDNLMIGIDGIISKSPTYPTGIPVLRAILQVVLSGVIQYRPKPNDLAPLHYAWAFVAQLIQGRGSFRRVKSQYQDALVRLGLDTESGQAFAQSLRTKFALDVSDEAIDPGLLELMMNPEAGELYRHEALSSRHDQVQVHLSEILTQTFFETTKGYLGVIGSLAGISKGDTVCVLKGSNSPVILRKASDYFTHIGTCHVWGLLFGEASRFGGVETLEIR